MKKLMTAVVCLAVVLGYLTAPYTYAAGLTVSIITENEPTDYYDPANPFIISIPVGNVSGSDMYSYVAVVETADGHRVLPYSVYRDGEISFISPRTGTYRTHNNVTAFSDTAGHWAENNILFVSARELFGGVGGGLFSPDTPMTRAMFVQVLANLENPDLSAYVHSSFSDVPRGAWYRPAVEWAAEIGITGGAGGGFFNPDTDITREQMAAMLVSYMEYKRISLPQTVYPAFNDENMISAWAYSSVRTLRQAGVIGGRDGNIFAPQGTASRAEVATVFALFITVYMGGAN